MLRLLLRAQAARISAWSSDSMTPEETKDANALIVDIRPRPERAEVGYIPGSISVPSDSADLQSELLVELKPKEMVVLFCTTGRRSAQMLEQLSSTFPEPIAHLEGGVLRWRAEGLPVCGVEPPQQDSIAREVQSIETFHKALRSCFVAEMVERSLSDERKANVDPMALLHQCFTAEDMSFEAPALDRLDRVLDRMGLMSKRMGTDLKTIAENTDRMVEVLGRLRASERAAPQ